jgi:hypothetical protein
MPRLHHARSGVVRLRRPIRKSSASARKLQTFVVSNSSRSLAGEREKGTGGTRVRFRVRLTDLTLPEYSITYGSINYTARTIVRLYVSLGNRAEWRATNLF